LGRAQSLVTSLSTDGYSRFTASYGTQQFTLINGQARVAQTITESFTSNQAGEGSYATPLTNPDQSFSRQQNTTTNLYNAVGKLDSVDGTGVTYSNDGFGNVTQGTVTQVYDQELLHMTGFVKVKDSFSIANTRN